MEFRNLNVYRVCKMGSVASKLEICIYQIFEHPVTRYLENEVYGIKMPVQPGPHAMKFIYDEWVDDHPGFTLKSNKHKDILRNHVLVEDLGALIYESAREYCKIPQLKTLCEISAEKIKEKFEETENGVIIDLIVLSTMDGFGVGGVVDGSEFTIYNSYIKMFHRNISQSSTLGTAIGILAAGDKSEDSKTMVKKIDHMSVLKKYHLSLNCIAYVFSKFFQSYCMLNICEKGITGTIAGVPVTLNITSGFGGDQVAMDANVRNTFGEAANISQSQIGLYDNFNNEIQLFFGKINWSIVHKYGVMLPI